jgi:hypothetical protein
MVGSLLLSMSAISVYRLNHAQEISINSNSWSWLSETKFRFDAGQDAIGPLLSEADLPEQIVVGPPAPLHLGEIQVSARTSSVARARVKATHSKKSWLAKAKSVFRRPNRPLKDAGDAAVILAEKTQNKVVAAATATSAAETQTIASQAELNTLQGLHQLLRGHLVLAMTTQPEMANVLVAQMGPQADSKAIVKADDVEQSTAEPAAAAVEVAPEPIEFRPLRKKTHHHAPKVVTLDKVTSTAPQEEVAEAPVTTQAAPADEVAMDEPSLAHPQDQIQSSQSAPSLQDGGSLDDYSVAQAYAAAQEAGSK